jgi:MFS family permease
MADRPDEVQEKLDRQLDELLHETRVVMPGVQVLFAFLLAVTFQPGFADASEFQRDVYFATLLASAATAALLIAPAAYHRIAFQHGRKEDLVRDGTRLMVAALVTLAIAMTGAVLLVTDVLFPTWTTVLTGAVTAAVFGWLWFGRSVLGRRRT